VSGADALGYISSMALFMLWVCIAFSFQFPHRDLEKAIEGYEKAQLARMGIVFFAAVFLATMIAKEFAA
jgi:hypothetical protein